MTIVTFPAMPVQFFQIEAHTVGAARALIVERACPIPTVIAHIAERTINDITRSGQEQGTAIRASYQAPVNAITRRPRPSAFRLQFRQLVNSHPK